MMSTFPFFVFFFFLFVVGRTSTMMMRVLLVVEFFHTKNVFLQNHFSFSVNRPQQNTNSDKKILDLYVPR